MSALTKYLRKAICDHVLGIAAYAQPTAITMSLHTADPTVDGLTTFEISTSIGYARQDVTGDISAAQLSTGQARLDVTANFGTATATWNVAYAAFHDENGAMLMRMPFRDPQTVLIGEPFQISPGQLLIEAGTDMTSFLQKAVLDHIFDVTPYPMPTSLLFGLHTGDPTASGSTIFEVSTSGTGYAPESVLGLFSPADADTGVSVLTSGLSIGPATTDWGELTHGSYSDQNGVMLLRGEFLESVTIPVGDPFELDAGFAELRFV